jgi:putative nucleotidyltransferase with HDIG domain
VGFAALSHPTLTQRVARSLTLLRVFVVASAVLLALAALVLGTILTSALRAQALEDAKADLTQYTNGVLSSSLLRDSRLVIRRQLPEVVERDLAVRPDIVSVKVWRADGVLAWTNIEPERIGKRFDTGHHLREVLETGEAEAEFEKLGEAEDEAEARLGVDHVIEVYAPIRGGRRVVGAYEVYANSATIEASIAHGKHVIWIATLAVLGVVWALLLLLVRGASVTLTGQTDKLRARSRQLMESYARLEENTLEAIETLNATVEAKDPYTAGHSRRVQEIALAIGRELGLDQGRLEALRLAGLFHDIGKLAVPDAILTKPARLTADEFALIQQHSEAGARIVGKLGRLRDIVPIIRHHHERWDGGGYPDGLESETIPLEAAIVGLADAWDAMTTDRPYHRSLTFPEAIEEIRVGRGSQFAPDVVDAFLATLSRGTVELARVDARDEQLQAAG